MEKLNKEKDFNYIKKFTNISVKQICEELHVDYASLMSKRSSAYNTKRVKDKLEEKINKIKE